MLLLLRLQNNSAIIIGSTKFDYKTPIQLRVAIQA